MNEQRRAIDMCACCHKANQHHEVDGDCIVAACGCQCFIPHPQPITGLDPGIEFLVHAFRAVGYDTTDSGDGWSKSPVGDDDPDALSYAHIFIQSTRERFFEESLLVLMFLRNRGEKARVEGSYSPADDSYLILCYWDGPKGQT